MTAHIVITTISSRLCFTFTCWRGSVSPEKSSCNMVESSLCPCFYLFSLFFHPFIFHAFALAFSLSRTLPITLRIIAGNPAFFFGILSTFGTLPEKDPPNRPPVFSTACAHFPDGSPSPPGPFSSAF